MSDFITSPDKHQTHIHIHLLPQSAATRDSIEHSIIDKLQAAARNAALEVSIMAPQLTRKEWDHVPDVPDDIIRNLHIYINNKPPIPPKTQQEEDTNG